MDPRIKRSRDALRQAMLTLIKEMDYDAIGVQDITDRANTARVTFYRHYANKEELLLDFLEDLYHKFAAQFQDLPASDLLDFNQEPPMQRIFEFVAQDRLLYKQLVTGPMASMLEARLRIYFVEMTRSIDPDLTDFEANFLTSNAISSLKWWLSDDLPYSAVYMARANHWLGISGIMAMRGELDRVTMPNPDMLAGTPYADRVKQRP
ncbi:MAG: TetR/AcrR family transcriptional regulator [Chloroflexota bacterium]